MSEPVRLQGNLVYVKNDDVNRALKKFKNKVEDSGKLKDLQKKEFYEKPTTARRKAKAAGKQRYKKQLEREQLPPKLF
jgi:small subunit ribosomal protein S21